MMARLSVLLRVGRARGAPPTPANGTVPLGVRLATTRDGGKVRRIERICFGWERILFGLWPRTGRGDSTVWVAESHGEPVAYLIAYEKVLEGRPVMYVGGVAVLPAFRRGGLGTQLMKIVLANHPSLWLHVRASNTAAIEMYARLGMRERRRLTGFYANGEDAIVLVTPDLADDCGD